MEAKDYGIQEMKIDDDINDLKCILRDHHNYEDIPTFEHADLLVKYQQLQQHLDW